MLQNLLLAFLLLPAMAGAASLEKWENLPCPSRAQFQKISQQLGLQSSAAFECDLSFRGKLGRLLHFLASLELKPDPTFGAVGEKLRNPFQFLAARTSVLLIDEKLLHAFAINHAPKKEIRLGRAFFSASPLESMSTLIHEARHSDQGQAEEHVACVQGDLPRALGGCDSALSTAETAGAYSFGVIFELLLARSGLVAEGDRISLETEASRTLLQRFNYLHPQLAHFQDLLVGLTAEGQLTALHPFANATIPAAGLPSTPAIERIAFDDNTGGLLLFHNGGKASRWAWGKAPTAYYPAALPADQSVALAGKLRLPQQHNTYPAFLSGDGKLFYLDFHSDTAGLKSSAYPLQPPFTVKDFFIGAKDQNHFLSQEGKLFRMENGGYVALQPSAPPFRHASGGVLHDSVNLVGSDGALYTLELPDDTADSASPNQDPLGTLKRMPLQLPVPATEYAEGTTVRAALDESGNAWAAYHGKSTGPRLLPYEKKLQSLAFLKLLALRGPLRTTALDLALPSLEAFERSCQASRTIRDPWFRRGVGLAKGRLQFELENGGCLEAELPEGAQGQVKSFQFSATFAGTEVRQNFYAIETALEITLEDGRKFRLLPYGGGRNFPLMP